MGTTSLDGLIAFLLDEIALCGEEGATVPKFSEFVHDFYARAFVPTGHASTSAQEVHAGGGKAVKVAAPDSPSTGAQVLQSCTSAGGIRPTIDHPFRAKVWQWVTAHPDVSVGENGTGNKLSLGDVERLDEDAVRENALHLSSQDANVSRGDDKTLAGAVASDKRPTSKVVSNARTRPTIRVKSERIWQTLTGHGVKPSECPLSEFRCLVAIAAGREQGILQTDLIRITGQDKRSIPHRTDFLHNKGYIVKKAALGMSGSRGMRTSLLIHRRFVSLAARAQAAGGAVKTGDGIPGQTSAPETAGLTTLDLDAFTRSFFEQLKEFELVAKSDIKVKLGVIGNRWKQRVLAHLIRRFETFGFIKRVRAASQFSQIGQFHECIKLLHLPDVDGMQSVWGSLKQQRLHMSEANVVEEVDSDDEGDGGELGGQQTDVTSAFKNDDPEDANDRVLLEIEKTVPQWTAKGSWGNMLLDVIGAAGTKGLSTMDVKAQTLGPFCDRPMEICLEKYAENFRLTQPVHLHRYGIVRDVAQVKKGLHYHFYTYGSFEELVAAGRAAWKEAESGLEGGKTDRPADQSPVNVSDSADSDEFGFPRLRAEKFFGHRGAESLPDIIRSAGVETYFLGGHDLVLVKDDDGSVLLDVIFEGPRGSDITGTKIPIKRIVDPNAPKKILGRPRKYPKGEEPYRSGVLARQKREKKELHRVKAKEREERRKAEQLLAKRTAEEAGLSESAILPARKLKPPPVPTRRSGRMRRSVVDLTSEGLESEGAASARPDVNVERSGYDAEASLDSPSPLVRRARPPKRSKEASVENQFTIGEVISDDGLLHGLERPTSARQPRKRQKLSDQLEADEDPPASNDDIGLGTGQIPPPETPKRRTRASREQNVRSKDSQAEEPYATTELALEESAPAHVGPQTPKRHRRSAKISNGTSTPTQNPTIELPGAVDSAAEVMPSPSNLLPQKQGRQQKKSQVSPRVHFLSEGEVGSADGGANPVEPNPTHLEDAHSHDTDTTSIPSGQAKSVPEGASPTSPGRGRGRGRGGKRKRGSAEAQKISDPAAEAGRREQQIDSVAPVDETQQPPSKRQAISKGSDTDAIGQEVEPQHPTDRDDAFLSPDPPQTPPSIGIETAGPMIVMDDARAVRSEGAPDTSAAPEVIDVEGTEVSQTLAAEPDAAQLAAVETPMQLLGNQNPAHGLLQPSEGTGSPSPSPSKQVKAERPKPPRKKGAVSTQGQGSLMLKRKRVILGLVDEHGGVFPGDKELWFPYTAAWLKENPGAGNPDQRTINGVQKALIDAGQLKSVIFAYTSSRGLRVQKKILTRPEIEPNSAVVQDLQKRMMDASSDVFVLPELDVQDEAIAKQLSRRHGDPQLRPQKRLAEYSSELVTIQHPVEPRVRPKVAPVYRERVRREPRPAKFRRERRAPAAERYPDMPRGPLLNPDEQREAAAKIRRLAESRLWMHRQPQGPTRVARLHSLHQSIFGTPNSSRVVADQSLSGEYEVSEFAADNVLAQISRRVAFTAPPQPFHRPSGTFGTMFKSLMPDNRRRSQLGQPGPHRAAPFQPEPSGFLMRPKRQYIRSGRYARSNLPNVRSDVQTVEVLLAAIARHNAFTAPPQPFHGHSGTFGTIFKPIEYLPGRGARLDRELRQQPSEGPRYSSLTPDALQFIINSNRKGRAVNHSLSRDPMWSEFEYGVDRVAVWEAHKYRNWPTQLMRGRFINHVVPWMAAAPASNCTLLWDDPESVRCTLTSPPRDDDLVKELRQHRERQRTKHAMKTDQAVETDQAEEESDEEDFYEPRQPEFFFKTRSLLPLKESEREPRSAQDGYVRRAGSRVGPDGQQHIARRQRGYVSKAAAMFTPDDDRRLLIAVAVIRCLAGGINRLIDFVLVGKTLPRWELAVIQRRWYNVRQRHHMQLEKLQGDFREAYLEAYEAGTVPAMNYDDLANYDWNWLVDWAQDTLDDPSSNAVPVLLQSRQHVADVYEVRRRPDQSNYWRDDYFAPQVPYFRRFNISRDRAMAVPLAQGLPLGPSAEEEQMLRAKSWIRANIITAEESYDPSAAKAKLLPLGDGLLEQALNQLRADKVLTHANKGRMVPGRNFDITDNLVASLKKNIDETQLLRAAAAKAGLDRAFRASGHAPFADYSTVDADVLAVFNLIAHRRVQLVPHNVPKSAFGLLDGSYRTRFLDKRRLYFDLDLRPTATYVYGNPLQPLPPPSRVHLGDDKAPIPVWYDIHDRLVPIMWMKALAGVLSTVAMRSGAGVEEIARGLRPGMETWEVEKVLGWMQQAGVVEEVGRRDRTGKERGWRAGEWWWLALGGGGEEAGQLHGA